ncbi:hypothetical protein [Limnobacter sp.]|uniref:hypothetical protein n=1 Tax=Limnobacter sp. TaxID=2003368 RepID=UPI003519399F
MIEWLVSMFLVPLFPALESPQAVHGATLAQLMDRLEQSDLPTTALERPADSPVKQVKLPAVSGRALERRSEALASVGGESATDAIAGLSLTGVVESAGRRFAIVTHGPDDHVVAEGSHVLGVAKVIQVKEDSLTLKTHTGPEAGKTIQLHLRGTQTEGAQP